MRLPVLLSFFVALPSCGALDATPNAAPARADGIEYSLLVDSCLAEGDDVVCGSDGRGPSYPPPREAARRGYQDRRLAPPPVTPPDVMARMLAAAAPYEVPGKPCLLKPAGDLVLTTAQRRRQREIQSDSYWLKAHIRDRFGSRLLDAGLHHVDKDLSRPVFRVRLTGEEPVPPMRLGDRATAVPVVVEYGMPYSHDELLQRAQANADVVGELVDLQGSYVSEGRGFGAIILDVFSPEGRPDPEALRQCDALREAYQMPVLIQFTGGRLMPVAGPAPRARSDR